MPKRPCITAEQAEKSIREMQEMSAALSKINQYLGSQLNGTFIEPDYENDSDFPMSLIRELSDKSIDEEIKRVVAKKAKKLEEKKKSSAKPKEKISREDFAAATKYMAQKAKEETNVFKFLKNIDKLKLRNRLLNYSSFNKSSNDPVKVFKDTAEKMIRSIEKIFSKKLGVVLTPKEFFNILTRVLLNYEGKPKSPLYVETWQVCLETEKYLNKSRKNWKPTVEFSKTIEKYRKGSPKKST